MPHTLEAFKILDGITKRIRDTINPKSLLYIGWRHDARPWWHDKFSKDLGIERISVLEVFPKNFRDLEHLVSARRYNVRPILGDVRNIHLYTQVGEYDIIFWDHGPEHVSFDELNVVTRNLIRFAGSMLLYCCPWGIWPQGIEDGNEHEEHKNSISASQLTNLGMDVMCINSQGIGNSGELIAYKMKGGK